MASFEGLILVTANTLATVVPDIPAGTNGAVFDIDFTSVQTWIKQENRIVLTESGAMDLSASVQLIIHYLVVALQKQDPSELEADDIKPLLEKIAYKIVQLELFALLGKMRYEAPAGPEGEDPLPVLRIMPDITAVGLDTPFMTADNKLKVTFRKGDTITSVNFLAMLAAEHASRNDEYKAATSLDAFTRKYTRLANVIVNKLRSEEGRMHMVHLDFPLKCLVANAVHRILVGGHNFLTSALDDKSSVAAQMVRMGGAQGDEFKAWLRVNGHDMWHCLTDGTIYTIAAAVTGYTSWKMTANAIYNGQDVANQNLCDILKLDDAVKDRYPPGVMGKSGLILGLSQVIAMLKNMGFKSVISTIDKAVLAVEGIVASLKEYNPSRKRLLHMKTYLGPLIATSLGYSSLNRRARDEIDQKGSLNYFKTNFPVEIDVGRTLGGIFEQLEHDPKALNSAIITLMSSIAAAVEKFNSEAPEIEQVPEVDEDTAVKVVTSAAVAKRRSAAVEATVAVRTAAAEHGFAADDVDYL